MSVCRSAVSTYEFPRTQHAVPSKSDKKRHPLNDIPGPRMKRSKSSSLNFPSHFERPTKKLMPVANVKFLHLEHLQIVKNRINFSIKVWTSFLHVFPLITRSQVMSVCIVFVYFSITIFLLNSVSICQMTVTSQFTVIL